MAGAIPAGLSKGDDGRVRCAWCGDEPAYQAYHDREWGVPTRDERLLFELLCLEGFQAGLSWWTILRKREAFRRAFADFDVARVARFRPARVDELLADAGIVRHRGKIEAVINNASRALELQRDEGSLAAHVWSFAPDPASRPRKVTLAALRAMTSSPESVALSKDLRKRGWSFVGPTTIYAFMQATGLVNDHLDGCWAREPAAAATATTRGR